MEGKSTTFTLQGLVLVKMRRWRCQTLELCPSDGTVLR